MDWVRIVLARCAALFRRGELDEDLDEELRAHIDLAVEEKIRRGMTRQDARTAALRELGGVTQTKEAYRLQGGMPLIEQIFGDVRFGIRQLRRSPGFAFTAILTLALGLGANTAVFSLIDGLLLRPLPVPHADQLAVLHYVRSDRAVPNFRFSAPMFRALEKRHEVFQDVAAFTSSRTMQVRSRSGNLEIPGAMVSGQFFRAMETPPILGRYLTPQDDQPGGASTGFGVVISEGFWQTWFNRAPDVVGRRMTIANAPFTVVGVMPKQFIGADPTKRSEIYVPLWAEPIIDAPGNRISAGYHSLWMQVIARRNPGVALEEANAALQTASNPVLDETAPEDADWVKDARDNHFQIIAEPGSTGFSRLRATFVKPLAAVLVLCVAMLLLACLNLASLLMARSAARERELATRLAMGATRRRLIQQLMVESLLIAVLGTAAGMIAAPLVSRSLAAVVLGDDRTAFLDTSLDMRLFAFVTLAAVVSTVLIGLIPALRATSKNLNEQIKSGSHVTSASERRRVLPRILMGLEVSLALILVIGAGLLGTSLVRLYRTGLGFDPRNLAELNLDMGKQPLDGNALLQWYAAFGDALKRLPGVKSASFGVEIPFDGSVWGQDFHTPFSSGDRVIYMNLVAPEYFQTMHIPVLSGRDFRWNDTMATGRKIVLTETAAKYLFPGQNPLGQHITEAENDDVYEVIGVAGDIQYRSAWEYAAAGAYIPMTQDPRKKPSYTAVVRVEGSTARFAAAARSLAGKMAPDIPAPVLTTMSEEFDASISSERMMTMLTVFFAGCALLVTAIGLYGTLAYAATRRTSEIGIRMALGAQRVQVVLLVFRENAWIAAGGSLCGFVAALFASRALASFLYGTSAHDPWVLVGSVAALILIASAASLVPALRAARIDPIQALRAE